MSRTNNVNTFVHGDHFKRSSIGHKQIFLWKTFQVTSSNAVQTLQYCWLQVVVHKSCWKKIRLKIWLVWFIFNSHCLCVHLISNTTFNDVNSTISFKNLRQPLFTRLHLGEIKLLILLLAFFGQEDTVYHVGTVFYHGVGICDIN